MRSSLAVAMVMVVGGGCATLSQKMPVERPAAAVAFAIDGVGIYPKTINVSQGEQTALVYALTQPARVTVEWVDEQGRVVRAMDAGEQPAGTHQEMWDGRAADGQLISLGVYRYVIRAQTAQGESVVYDPSRETGGEEMEPRAFVYDPSTGQFRWVMPTAGYARLRVGLQGFPHLRTLLDWEPLEGGEQQLVWDGLDASGLVIAHDHPQLSITLSAFAMPQNTLIVHGHSVSERSGVATDAPARYLPLSAQGTYLHARHPRAVCHELPVRVEFPSATRFDEQHRPILAGVVPVRVLVDEPDRAHLMNEGFELALYEDLTFLTEDEQGVQPFTYLWNVAALSPGVHLLTVNILSYTDHYGVVTQPVRIEPSS